MWCLQEFHRCEEGYSLRVTEGVDDDPDESLEVFFPRTQEGVRFALNQLMTLGVPADGVGNIWRALHPLIDVLPHSSSSDRFDVALEQLYAENLC